MNKRGFTLIELIVVMVLLGILLAIAAPSMLRWRESAQIKGVARDILGGLRQARSMAVALTQDVTASLNLDSRVFSYNGVTRVLSSDVAIAADNDTSLVSTGTKVTTFHPQGSCSDPIYIRVNNDQNLEIQIDSMATGLARLQDFPW